MGNTPTSTKHFKNVQEGLFNCDDEYEYGVLLKWHWHMKTEVLGEQTKTKDI